MDDEPEQSEPDTCHECGELAVGFDHDTSAMLCAKCYRAKPAFWETNTAKEN